jgi:hypothetical protein
MRLFLLLLAYIVHLSAYGQERQSVSLFDSLYSLRSDLKITLTYPFDSLYRNQQHDIEATISIETGNSHFLKHTEMTINLRGKFRRMKCTMPPLLLNFKKSTLRQLGLNTVDEIKLVTHCMENLEGQENLQEERLCYQLYETLTPYAYRTIWAKVEYHDTSDPSRVIVSTGFLLEPDKVLSARLEIIEQKKFNIPEDSLHFESYNTTTVFNFLIGNRDWSVVGCRNAKLFYDSLKAQYVVIPYDFDYANIVGATYRRETLPASMNHPFDRLYEGEYFKDRACEMLKNFQPFRPKLMALLETIPNPMDTARRKKIEKYFDTWFNMIEKCKPEEMKYGLVCPYKGGL